jgi:hypothetical protein
MDLSIFFDHGLNIRIGEPPHELNRATMISITMHNILGKLASAAGEMWYRIERELRRWPGTSLGGPAIRRNS